MDVESLAQSIGKLVLESGKDPYIDYFYQEVRLRQFMGISFLEALLHTAVSKIAYKKEPEGRDEWQSAKETLKKETGDCEDFTILIGATLLKASMLVRFKIVKAEGNYFNHIYPFSFDEESKNWVALDATLANPGLGREGASTEQVLYGLDGGVYRIGESLGYFSTNWLLYILIIIVIFLLLKTFLGG